MDEPRSRKATFQLRTANYNDHSSSRRSSSVLSRSHSPSPTPSETYQGNPVIVGVCAMDIKARSKAMREILTRLVARGRGNIEVKVFGDKVILDEDVENWPRCDILISFFSTDFPLRKAVEYVKLRSPVCINDLAMQELLWDRRCVLRILDHVGVPCPHRVEVSRDGGPTISEDVKAQVEATIELKLEWPVNGPEYKLREDKDAIIVNGKVVEKPFVEKPVSGEDHNINIYFRGGGGRRLFRKIGNQSSVYDPDLVEPRTDGSYIYEEFIDVENAEDIKVYTVGSTYTHAETRKSPVIDGLVRRNTEGKEIRFITRLSDEEVLWARKICEGFGQRVCGFDVLRPKGSERSMVIDVNGWSFVKGNESYYDRVSDILAELCFKVSVTPTRRTIPQEFLQVSNTISSQASSPRMVSGDVTPTTNSNNAAPESGAGSGSWMLKANVTVFRHADRTPKQKLKYSFPVNEPWTQPFIKLLNGATEEIFLREREQLNLIVSELYDALKFSALHHRTFLFAIFSDNGGKVDPNDRRLHELYARAKALFDLVAPQEYGIEASEKEEIGVLTSLPLLRKIVADLEAVRNSGGSGLTVYFTKESHIHTLVNLVLYSGLPIANPRIPELDYSSHITFELYERSGGHNKTDKEYSIRLSISEGAHSSNVLDSALDARHALNVKPRR
ncbi:hypothetical protein M407DRAFT_11521 [Tulasnella calospora MUT 4182]|uniref:Inositol hexakisphosphate and diphosphoinositol-pentakisphosphate kinase n=1 Tax=Tulasnella calospora MUT 4182 TaxID=1051891 RepID=A0A0C3Q624_9AGAM|nr:hypothetical protein M407DRAFT_11521 [Tulasnella calospora MUT 4182]